MVGSLEGGGLEIRGEADHRGRVWGCDLNVVVTQQKHAPCSSPKIRCWPGTGGGKLDGGFQK